MSDERRRAVGRTLLIVGALSTIPLLIQVLGHKRRHELPAPEPA